MEAYAKAEGLALSQEIQDRLVAVIAEAVTYIAPALVFGKAAQNPFSPVPFALLREYGGQSEGSPRSLMFSLQDESLGEAQRTVTFDDLVEGWVAEKQPREKTHYAWGRVIDDLAEFLGRRNVSNVTTDNIIAWKAKLVRDGLQTRTIRFSKLAAVNAIFPWRADNRKILSNPAERVTIKIRTRIADRRRGYTDAEARKVVQSRPHHRPDAGPLRWLKCPRRQR